MEETNTPTRIDTPRLVAPREASVVNGNAVTFVWEPVEDAEEYILQVASDAKFNTLVIDENVEQQTAVTVGGYFPTDEQTFFWRVLAVSGDIVSPGERVESFIAADEAEAEKHLATPQADETMGPVTELVRAASADVSAKMLEPTDRFEEEKEIGVAYEGIAAGQILSIALSILVVVGIAVVVLFNWFNTTSAATQDATVNADQYTNLRETEAEAERQLGQYEVLNEQEGVYRIPIDRAMDQIATQSYREQKLDREERGRPPQVGQEPKLRRGVRNVASASRGVWAVVRACM